MSSSIYGTHLKKKYLSLTTLGWFSRLRSDSSRLSLRFTCSKKNVNVSSRSKVKIFGGYLTVVRGRSLARTILRARFSLSRCCPACLVLAFAPSTFRTRALNTTPKHPTPRMLNFCAPTLI